MTYESSEYITRIERRARFPQQGHELLLETPLAVMLRLVRNVIAVYEHPGMRVRHVSRPSVSACICGDERHRA